MTKLCACGCPREAHSGHSHRGVCQTCYGKSDHGSRYYCPRFRDPIRIRSTWTEEGPLYRVDGVDEPLHVYDVTVWARDLDGNEWRWGHVVKGAVLGEEGYFPYRGARDEADRHASRIMERGAIDPHRWELVTEYCRSRECTGACGCAHR